MDQARSVQEMHAPQGRCFGCGPANGKGLRIRSFPIDGTAQGGLRAHWQPEDHHEAFEGVLNGGIIGALLDCHSNWTAAYFLYKRDALELFPSTVTADFHVKLMRPTPSGKPVELAAQVVESGPDRATVEATMHAEGKLTATCRGLFIAVKPGHPAYQRW